MAKIVFGRIIGERICYFAKQLFFAASYSAHKSPAPAWSAWTGLTSPTFHIFRSL